MLAEAMEERMLEDSRARNSKKVPLCSDNPEHLLYTQLRSGAWWMQMNNWGVSWGLPCLTAIRRFKYAKNNA